MAAMAYLGVDVGGTSIKVAAVDAGRTLWTGRSAAYSRPDARGLIMALREAAGGHAVDFQGVGLCVPGILDANLRRVTLSVNVPGLMQIDLEELVHSAMGEGVGSIRVINDTTAAAHDIASRRGLSGRVLVLCLGTGIGAAVVDDGVPVKVTGQTPGHIGQLDVSLDDRPPIGPDGGAGSLEAYLGAPALMRQFGLEIPAAVAAWDGSEAPLRALARALRICHAIYRPNHIVLAGGIGIHLGHVVGALKEMVARNLTSVARAGWTLSTGESEFHAAIGAAKLRARK